MDFKFFLNFILIQLQFFTIQTINNGYLKTDTIKLNTNLPIKYEIADLNKLLKDTTKPFLIKFVQTNTNSKLFKFINYDDQTGQILLTQKLNLNDLCNITSNKQTCQFNLQLIVLNRNKFIEIPIEIIDDIKIKELSLDENLNIGYKFIIDCISLIDPTIDSKEINFKIEEEFYDYDVNKRQNLTEFKDSKTFRLLLSSSLNNKVIVVLNKKLSFKQQNFYRLKLSSYHNETLISNEFVHISLTGSLNNETESILTPLEFENLTYSLTISADMMPNTNLINIKLKNSNSDSIIYSFVFDNESIDNNNNNSVIMNDYFKIDNGLLTIKKSIGNLNINFIKLKIKATYKHLLNNNDLNFNENYFIPAFCVVKIIVVQPSTVVSTTTIYVTTRMTTAAILSNYTSYPVLYGKMNEIAAGNNSDVFLNITNFNSNEVNLTKINGNECVIDYEIGNNESRIEFKIVEETNFCLKNITISSVGCLKFDVNETCGLVEASIKFKVCFVSDVEKCSRIYTQNLKINSTYKKKNTINLFIDYAQQNLFNSAILVYGFLIAIVFLFFALFFLLCCLNKRKNRYLMKKKQQLQQQQQPTQIQQEEQKQKLSSSSILTAIKYKIMTKKQNYKNYNDGCTLTNEVSPKIPSKIQVLDDCFHSRQNLTHHDALKKQNIFANYIESSSPSISSSEDYHSKYTRYLSMSKTGTDNG
jgi:hypothetical protein